MIIAQVVDEFAAPIFVNVPHGHSYVNLEHWSAAIIPVVVARGTVIETRSLCHIARLPEDSGVLRGTCSNSMKHAKLLVTELIARVSTLEVWCLVNN
jgi:hypothetical protein